MTTVVQYINAIKYLISKRCESYLFDNEDNARTIVDTLQEQTIDLSYKIILNFCHQAQESTWIKRCKDV